VWQRVASLGRGRAHVVVCLAALFTASPAFAGTSSRPRQADLFVRRSVSAAICQPGFHYAGLLTVQGKLPKVGETWSISIRRNSSALNGGGDYRELSAYVAATGSDGSGIWAGLAQGSAFANLAAKGKGNVWPAPHLFTSIFVRGVAKLATPFGSARLGRTYLIRLTHLSTTRWRISIGGSSRTYAFTNGLWRVGMMTETYQAKRARCPAFNFSFSGLPPATGEMIRVDGYTLPQYKPYLVSSSTASNGTTSFTAYGPSRR
jgi:hypothetical protein